MITHYTQGLIKLIHTNSGIGNVFVISLLITFCFNLAWIFVCTRECYRFVNKYLTCKRFPDLHPIYKDVQYLSRQRKLYNLETHIVKYVLVILCLSVEGIGIVCVVTLAGVFGMDESRKLNATRIRYESHYPNCHLHYQIWELYSIPIFIWLHNISFFLYFLLFVLISILTRYLAARYLNHPFNKTLYRYVVGIFVQFCIVAFSSNKYTYIFSYCAFPLLFIINWLVLLRDNRILYRVLRSNLTELDLHTNNRVLYHEQVSGYRYYNFFQKVLLASLFFLIAAIIMFSLIELFYLFNDSFCLLNIVYKFNYTLSLHIDLSPPQITVIKDIMTNTCFLIYSLSNSLPIICITLFPLIRACVKRYNSRYMVYRYNYENTQPLIRR